MANIILKNGRVVPRFSVVDRERTQLNGFMIPQKTYMVLSGSVDANSIGTTTVSASIDTYAFELRRIEVFHSGAASAFDFVISNERSSTNPLAVIASYEDVAGSVDFSSGIDQIENLMGLSDSGGTIYLKFTPNILDGNHFKYLLFIEPINVYINKDTGVQHL